MPQEGEHNGAKDQPENEPQENRRKGFRPLWLSDVFAGWIFVTLAALSGLPGGALLNGHPKPLLLAWGMIFIAISCMGGSAYFWLLNHRKRQVKNKMPPCIPIFALLGFVVFGFGVSGFAIWQEKPSEDQKYSGELLPAHDPFPLLPGDVPTNGIMLLLGKSVNVVRHFPHTVIMRQGKSVLEVSTNSHGASISAEFFDKNRTIVAVLESNQFNVNPLNSFRLERPDKSSLKVRDQQNIVVLDVRFCNPKLIKLNGAIRFSDGKEALIDENRGIFSAPTFYWDNFVDVMLE